MIGAAGTGLVFAPFILLGNYMSNIPNTILDIQNNLGSIKLDERPGGFIGTNDSFNILYEHTWNALLVSGNYPSIRCKFGAILLKHKKGKTS